MSTADEKQPVITLRLPQEEYEGIKKVSAISALSMNRWCRRVLRIVARLERQAWDGGPPPVRNDGHVVIVELITSALKYQPKTLRGQPLIVACYQSGLEATVGDMTFNYKEVSRWREIELDFLASIEGEEE